MSWLWCGIAWCSAISRAVTSCLWSTFRFPGRPPGVSSARCGIAVRRCWTENIRRRAAILAGCVTIAASIAVQMRPSHLNHLSRWGHWAAGRWLADHARPSRGGARHPGLGRVRLRTSPSYDYWHVRQALTDSHLAYVVVGHDELEAASPRATTLRAVLAYAADPGRRSSPSRTGEPTPASGSIASTGPTSWEGLRADESRLVLRNDWFDGVALDLGRPSGTARRCRPTSTRRS